VGRGPGDQPDQVDQVDQVVDQVVDQPDQVDQPDRVDRVDRASQAERANRPQGPNRENAVLMEVSGLPGVYVARAPAAVVRALRHGVLRPGRPESESLYPEDLDPATVHVAARVSGSVSGERAERTEAVLAVGTALRSAPPWDPGVSGAAWRVRGMATAAQWRGRGLGAAVLDALVSAVTAAGATVVWCNARVPARRLYERAGFSVRGDVFDVPHLGPHLVMWRTVGLCQPIGVAAPGAPGDAR
jgi:GNAT superfamily N-acetyltransferase